MLSLRNRTTGVLKRLHFRLVRQYSRPSTACCSMCLYDLPLFLAESVDRLSSSSSSFLVKQSDQVLSMLLVEFVGRLLCTPDSVVVHLSDCSRILACYVESSSVVPR